MLLRLEEPDDQRDECDRQRDIDDVAAGQRDRRAAHAAGELEERDDRPGECNGADGDAERHFDQALAVDGAFGADAEGRGRVERAGGDQHRGHADQRMEGGDQLRHRRHRHAPRDHRAGAAADRHAQHDQSPSREIRRRVVRQRGDDRDRHAGHAQQIAAPAGLRIRQSAQRQDEQGAGDEIAKRGEVGAHRLVPSRPARAGYPRLCSRAVEKTWMAGSSPAMTTTFCEEQMS